MSSTTCYHIIRIDLYPYVEIRINLKVTFALLHKCMSDKKKKSKFRESLGRREKIELKNEEKNKKRLFIGPQSVGLTKTHECGS